jgi:hypothetical protein
MDMHAGLISRLLADNGLTALVGTRVNWVTRPQAAALPAVTLQTISDGRPQHLKGDGGARDTRIQVDVWATKHSVALAIARVVIATLQPPAIVAGKKFGPARVEGQQDLGEDVNGTFVHRQSVDLIIWHVGD